MNYTIYTVTIPGYPHTRCFEELSIGLASGFRELGYSAKETGVLSEIEGRAIVLGAHLIKDAFPLPPDAIIYNTEQIGSEWLKDAAYMCELREHTVWDYSQENVRFLRGLGMDAHFCGVGYAPELERTPKVTEDLDCVFFGSINERRAIILEKLIDAGINLYIIPFGTYGAERDAILARAKIVLNIHYYEDAPFEIVRCSYLMANGIYFLSEGNRGDFGDYPVCDYAPYEKLVERCALMLEYPADRKYLALSAKEHLRDFHKQSDYIKAALSSMAGEENQPSPEQPQSLQLPSGCEG